LNIQPSPSHIEFNTGDILWADVVALVNPVNCLGVMGAGLAAKFKAAYPENFKAYVAACDRGDVYPGRLFVFDLGRLGPRSLIINFPTKRRWTGKSTLAYIETGLAALVREVKERSIPSIAIPALGCGLGGLAWSDVRPLIERAFAGLPDVRVVVYEPLDQAGRPPRCPPAAEDSPKIPRSSTDPLPPVEESAQPNDPPTAAAAVIRHKLVDGPSIGFQRRQVGCEKCGKGWEVPRPRPNRAEEALAVEACTSHLCAACASMDLRTSVPDEFELCDPCALRYRQECDTLKLPCAVCKDARLYEVCPRCRLPGLRSG